MKTTLAVFAAIAIAHPGAALPSRATSWKTPTTQVPDSVLEELRKGGLVLVFRHVHTDRSKMDDEHFSLADRSTQRNISDKGVAQARAIGAQMSALGIRVGEVLASPMYRTRETAEHAFGRVDTTELLRSRRTSAEALALLTAAPDSGVNRALITHNAYIMHHFTSMGHGQIAEGEVIVVRPLGTDGYKVIGRVTADEWESLTKRTAPSPNHARAQDVVESGKRSTQVGIPLARQGIL